MVGKSKVRFRIRRDESTLRQNRWLGYRRKRRTFPGSRLYSAFHPRKEEKRLSRFLLVYRIGPKQYEAGSSLEALPYPRPLRKSDVSSRSLCGRNRAE